MGLLEPRFRIFDKSFLTRAQTRIVPIRDWEPTGKSQYHPVPAGKEWSTGKGTPPIAHHKYLERAWVQISGSPALPDLQGFEKCFVFDAWGHSDFPTWSPSDGKPEQRGWSHQMYLSLNSTTWLALFRAVLF